MSRRPTSLTVLAWFLIVISGIGAATNAYALFSALEPYPQWLWGVLLAVKVAVISAAMLLLKMRKEAAAVYVVAVVVEFAISLLVTRSYTPVPAWQYAVSVGLNALYAFFVGRHWSKLSPHSGAGGATQNA